MGSRVRNWNTGGGGGSMEKGGKGHERVPKCSRGERDGEGKRHLRGRESDRELKVDIDRGIK